MATPYQLPEAETWEITSDEGQRYRIYVSLPAGNSSEPYPVLYVLDGNAMFAGFAEARRIQSIGNAKLDKMIIVGVGYPSGELYDGRRLFDFTAPIGTESLKKKFAAYPAGGRDRFEAFLLNRLRPEILRRYPADREHQSLFGHSLGGLFALHLFYNRPAEFETIVAASPSIWWDNQAILKEEDEFRRRVLERKADARATRLLLLAGQREEMAPMVNDAVALGKRLESLSGYGLRSEVEILDDETHLTVPSRAVTTTMRAVMPPR